MSKILIVDDMAIVRDPIAIALQQAGYETLCATNGREALELVRAQHPDLILLDISMPVMDGTSCLKALRQDQGTNDTPVLMLTDTTAREVVAEAAKLGVQAYLLKSSFSLDEMLAQVRRHLDTAKHAKEEKAERTVRPKTLQPAVVPNGECSKAPPRSLDELDVIRRILRAPAVSAMCPVLHHVLSLTRSSTSSFDEISSALHNDQGLALRVLKVANSSFYGRQKPVQTLAEAVQVIGLTDMQNVVAAILVIEHFDTTSPSGIIAQRFWEHSLAAALGAQAIAQDISPEQSDAEPLFLAGLLHDIGRMLLDALFPEEYKWVLESATRRGVDMTVPEQEVFGLNHGDVTRELLRHWKLSRTVIEAAALHHLEINQIKQAARLPQDALVVALGNRLAHALAIGCSGDSMLLPICDYAKALDLNGDAVYRIAQDVIQKTRDITCFYACQTDERFREPFAVELAKSVEGQVRLTVLAGDAPSDPLALFFEQLGWLDAVRPHIAVMAVSSEWDLAKGLIKLQKLEATLGVKLPVLVASRDGSAMATPQVLHERPSATMKMPCRYEAIVENVVKLRDAFAPEVFIDTRA